MPSGVYARVKRICNIGKCIKKHYCKGLCRKHYKEQYRKKKIKQYYQDNKEHISKYYQDNKEHVAKRGKQYAQTPAGKASQKANNKKYRKTSIGRASIKASAHNRRTLVRDLTKETIQQVYEDNIKKYGQLTCILCFKPIEFGDDSLEHLTPITREGTNNYENLGVAHQSCNSQKHTKTLSEWFNK